MPCRPDQSDDTAGLNHPGQVATRRRNNPTSRLRSYEYKTPSAVDWQCGSDVRLHQLCLDRSANDVAFSSELWTSREKSVIQASVRSWDARKLELMPEYTECILDARSSGPNETTLKWRSQWVPRQLMWLVSIGRSWPGVEVELYTILDR